MNDEMNARVFLLLMAARMVGDYLYSWGGEEAREGGFDCSGFASIALMQTARACYGSPRIRFYYCQDSSLGE